MRVPETGSGTTAASLERRRIAIRGTVQGVGFRPFVHRLASEHGLAGWVRNTDAGVELEVEGPAPALEHFARRLRADAPVLARIDAIAAVAAAPRGAAGFTIRPSRRRTGRVQPISPDVATCGACLAEVLDPADRRYRYPFTNCTGCGPRFTVIEALPYDRARTTMRAFPLCYACRAEYLDPADRRFHAEPIACPACGPRLELVVEPAEREPVGSAMAAGGADRLGRAAAAARGAPDPIDGAVAVLRAGGIVAVKGLGGFQLACDAASEDAVRRLRERKARDAKPFALMVPDLDTARRLCRVDPVEAEALSGRQAPIVLLERRPGDAGPSGPIVAGAVAPGLDTLGLMLPYSPLHHLLLRGCGRPLLLTSGNRAAEPIAASNEEALRRLAGIADAFLVHDRAIASRYDDSVVRIDDGHPTVLRRARGYAPEPLRLPRRAAAPILAVGAQLKSTFCLVRDDRAFPSQHLGDLDDAATLANFHETLALFRRLFRVEPEVVAHDLHPDYAATRFAASLDGVARVGVQHHHAHVVSCLAEHGFDDAAIGVAFDGAGYGPDGAVWGGELLVADWRSFRRTAHLAYLPLPGGDAAAREPWRMAIAALAAAHGDEAGDVVAETIPDVPAARRNAVLRLARRGLAADGGRAAPHAPPTSSAGRLFDAVAALAGICHENRYEGQAAMELEACVDRAETTAYPLPLGTGAWDVAPLVRAVVADVRDRVPAGRIAARFHNGLAAAVRDGCGRVRAEHGLDTVVLTGGCFQNRILLGRTRAALHDAGFRVLTHRCVPPGDGGISVGQAAVAVARQSSQE